MVLRGIDLHSIRALDDKSTSWKRSPLASNTFWSRLARYGPFWQGFLFSDPFICEDATDEHWIPRRALGKGSFGHVGLWELKRAEDGEVLDRMAIKQRLMSDDLADYDGPWRRHLAYEAVVQSQLCSMASSENITRLRKYKYFGSADATSATVRLYMEYAKHGTLEDLLDRYRAWDMHFSELFLWHTFLGLARAIDLMRQCPRDWQSTAVNTLADDHTNDRSVKDFVVHMDFKTANVALGKRKRFEFDIDRHGEDGADDSDSSLSGWDDQPESDEDGDGEDRLSSEEPLLGSEGELLGSGGGPPGSDGERGIGDELPLSSRWRGGVQQQQAQPLLQNETVYADASKKVRRDVDCQQQRSQHQANEKRYQQHHGSFSDVDGDDEFQGDEIVEDLEDILGLRDDDEQCFLDCDNEISADGAMEPITSMHSHYNRVVQQADVEQAPTDERECDISSAPDSAGSASARSTSLRSRSLDSLPEDRPQDFETSEEEEEHPDRFPRYPTIKIIDFGSSRRTGPDDNENPAQFDDWVGTPFWRSPEQRRWGNSVNPSPLNPPPPLNPPAHRYQSAHFQVDEKANVWNVGKIMHDMMTLSRASDVDKKLDSMVVSNTVWQQTYRQLVGSPRDRHTLRHFTERLATTKRDEYTPALRRLVWRCIRPCRSFRPSSSRLVDLVKAGLKSYIKQVGEQRRLRGRRFRRAQDLNQVHLSVDDFNKIKRRGEASRQVDPDDGSDVDEWLQLIDRPYADFDEPMPAPPKNKWRRFYTEYPLAKHGKQPDVQGQNWGHAGHKILFNKDRKKKRVMSWDAQSQPDPAFRNKLNLMRMGLRGLADNRPMALLEYVLNHEKGDEDAATGVVRWLYGNNRNPGWRWLQDEIIKARADVVKKRSPRRTKKECLYFVANAGQSVERVDQAVGDLTTVFG